MRTFNYSENFIMTLFITAKFFTTSVVFAQKYQFSLNLSSLKQKFKLFGDKHTVIVKRVDYHMTSQLGVI